MKRSGRFGVGALCALLLAALLFTPLMCAAKEPTPQKLTPDKATITGTVVEVKNPKGKVTGVHIQTSEVVYSVSRKIKGRELMRPRW